MSITPDKTRSLFDDVTSGSSTSLPTSPPDLQLTSSSPCLRQSPMRYSGHDSKSLGADGNDNVIINDVTNSVTDANSTFVICDPCRERLRAANVGLDANMSFYNGKSSRSDVIVASNRWTCGVCGATVRITRIATGKLDSKFGSVFEQGRKRRKSLRRIVSKVHKGFLSKFIPTAELPEGDQNHSSVTRSSTTSRSYADLSDEEHCNVTNNSEVCDKIEEHCDITTNGLHETPNGIPTFNSNTSNSQLSSSAPKRIESRRSEPSLPISASDNIMSQQPKTTQAEINGHVMQRQPDVTSSTNDTTSSKQPTDPANIGVSFKSSAGTLFLPLEHTPPNFSPLTKSPSDAPYKHGSRKKKRSASWYNVLNPTYKQKNVDFHKFFKKLPETERLIVDHSCALMKDILVQGRLYVSQNYVCFHSNILKWQTAVTIGFKDIVCLTKEKTVKVFPNAIQFQVKGRNKFTFTSFTSRDRAHYQINRLWQNALMDKPMTPHQLWNSVRKHYGSDLGCSSDDDYVRPTNVFDYGIDSGTPTDEIYKFGTTNKVPRTTQGRYEGGDVIDGEGAGPQVSISDPSSEDGDKSLSGCSMEDDDVINMRMDVIDDDDEAEYSAPSFKRTYLVRQYDCSAAELFDVIYGDDCDFWRQYLKKRETFDITIDRWSEGSGEYEGHRVRNMNYNLTLNNPLGPKSSNVDELQVWYNHSEHDRQYTVDCTAHTHGVPYSDYFRTVMRYQIRKLTQTTSELRVSAKLVFNKTPWGLVKNFIEKNCYSGLEENFQMLEPELNAFVSEMNASKRRESESPNRDFPRQRLSISSGDGIRRRDKKSSSGDSPTENHDIRNGDVIHTNHVTGADDVINSPISSAPATPLHDVNNNNSKHVEQRSVTRGGKSSLKVVAFVVFALLVVSNYSLYLRVASLERLHSMQGNDVMMTLHPDSHQEPPVTATDSIEHRLLRFENLLQNHVTSLEGRWRKLNADWLELRSMMNQILEQSSKSTVKT